MAKRAKIDPAFEERLRRLLADAVTYGQLEALAGVTDRVAWWQGKTEEQAREELKRLIRERLRNGEFDDDDRENIEPGDYRYYQPKEGA